MIIKILTETNGPYHVLNYIGPFTVKPLEEAGFVCPKLKFQTFIYSSGTG